MRSLLLRTFAAHPWNEIFIEWASAFLLGGFVTEGLVEILKAGKELAWLVLANLKLSPKLRKGFGSTRALAHSIHRRLMLWLRGLPFRGLEGSNNFFCGL